MMNKEEAKIKLRTELRDMDVPPEETVEMGDLIGTTIDAIESEHKPVGLPKWLCDKLDRSETVMPFVALSAINFRANGDQSEWFESLDNQRKTMRAFADGWVPEEEQKWFIRVPHTKLANGRSQWYGKNSKGNSCFASKELLNGVEVQRAINTAWMFSKEDIEDFRLEDCEKVEAEK